MAKVSRIVKATPAVDLAGGHGWPGYFGNVEENPPINLDDARADVMGAMPVVIGFDMAPATERHVIEPSFDLLAPCFSHASADYGAPRMREVAELF